MKSDQIGFPYIAIRILPGTIVRHEIPFHFFKNGKRTRDSLLELELVKEISRQSQLRKMSFCIVFAKEDCLYFNADGSTSHSTSPPSGGIRLTGNWTSQPRETELSIGSCWRTVYSDLG